jgi:RNase P subunit RPR2
MISDITNMVCKKCGTDLAEVKKFTISFNQKTIQKEAQSFLVICPQCGEDVDIQISVVTAHDYFSNGLM